MLKFILNYKCPFRLLFNFYCAGCGTTRMFLSILKGNFYQAFRYNPLMFIYLILLIIYTIYLIIFYIKNQKIKLPNLKVIIVLVIIAFIFMFLRNTSYFDYLKPTVLN